MARKYEWDKLKTKYISGNYKNLKEFAEKEKVNYDVLRRHAAEWQEAKSHVSHTKVTKTVAKTIEKYAEIQSDRNIEQLKAADAALAEIIDYFTSGKCRKHVFKSKKYSFDGRVIDEELETRELDVPDTRAILNMIKGLADLQKTQRIALGLDVEKAVNPEAENTEYEKIINDSDSRELLKKLFRPSQSMD